MRQKYLEQQESDQKVKSETKTKKTINDYRKEINLDENLNLLSKEELDKKKKKMTKIIL